ncbi:MAG: signal peptidase I [Clostridiaceae bacterium]|nr:signal peptidase I [Clostridiaceae bacterium]
MPETRYTTQEEIDDMRLEIARALEKRQAGNRKAGSRPAKIFSWALFSLIMALLVTVLASILIAKNKGQTPSVLGYHLFRIETGSMEPTLPVGSVILSRKPKDASALEEGRIVTFESPSGALVTHRIIRVVQDEEGQVLYITKGDNPINDPDNDLLSPEGILAVFLLKIPLT